MCLALPALVVAIESISQATVSLGGVKKQISLELVPETVVGDYVIVHVGYAIGTIDAQEAERTIELFAQVQQ